jgi:hypothetical protein
MGRQQVAHGEQIVNHEHAFLRRFRIRRHDVSGTITVIIPAACSPFSRGSHCV